MQSKNALVFIFITVLLDAIGLGIIIPVLPKLIMELIGKDLSDAAIYGGWLLFVYSVMQFFFAPVLGNLSDRYGRRPVLLLSLLALSFDYGLMYIAPTIGWLFLGRILAGIAGATYGTASAYIADISTPDKRAQNFGMIGAAFGFGFIIGPAVGGILGEYGARIPFFAASALALATAIYGFFVLPETLSQENRRDFSWKRSNPLGTFLQMFKIPSVIGLLIVLFFYQLSHDVYPSIWSYYNIEKFQWSESEIGYSLAFMGVMIALIQGGLIRTIIPKVGENNAVYLGFVMTILGFLGFAFATSSWQVYVFIVLSSLSGIASPALRSIMSNQVQENEQGELQGAITSLVSLSAIISPLVMTQTFGYFTSESAPFYFPGASFVVAAILVLMSMIQFRISTIKNNRK